MRIEADGDTLTAIDGDGVVAGTAGWIWVASARQAFVAPLFARDEAAAAILIDALTARARAAHAVWIRAGAREPHTRDALIARGFAPKFEFLTMSCASARVEHAPPTGLTRIALAEADVPALIAIHDDAMLGVDNAGPMTLDEAHRAQTTAWADASGLWLDERGRAAAFAIILREGANVTIDTIGTAASHRHRGIARALVDRTVDLAAQHGATAVHALIASTNAASLALHAAAGFRESRRRPIYELTL